VRFYPFFWGHGHERGEGPGEGFSRNLPLALGTRDDEWLAAFEEASAAIRAYAPDALVVALGLDAFEGDPLKGMRITSAGFARIGAAVGALGAPTVLVQEGGYPCPELGENLVRFLEGFEGS